MTTLTRFQILRFRALADLFLRLDNAGQGQTYQAIRANAAAWALMSRRQTVSS